MIYGHLDSPAAYSFLLGNEAWRMAFDWLKKLPPDIREGIHPILGDKLWANVHGYQTLPRAECRFESHQRHVDLQYCIKGGELIDWQLVPRLTPAGPFDEPNDVQFYQPAETQTVLQMLPGAFGIFFPDDAHRPKVADGWNQRVAKLVIKVSCELLG